jgi:hypothetical protein
LNYNIILDLQIKLEEVYIVSYQVFGLTQEEHANGFLITILKEIDEIINKKWSARLGNPIEYEKKEIIVYVTMKEIGAIPKDYYTYLCFNEASAQLLNEMDLELQYVCEIEDNEIPNNATLLIKCNI